MSPIQYDPEEEKRQAKIWHERAIAVLEKRVQGGFWKFMGRGFLGSITLAFIMSMTNRSYYVLVIAVSPLIISPILWHEANRNLEKLKAKSDLTYYNQAASSRSYLRLIVFAIVGFSLMFGILFFEMHTS